MVTGTTDDGSYPKRQLVQMCCYCSRLAAVYSAGQPKELKDMYYLRNTALGASSPANPALHIPELQINQSSILKVAGELISAEIGSKRSKLLGPEVWFSQLPRISGATHPLSITRAATSSVYSHCRQQCHYVVIDMDWS